MTAFFLTHAWRESRGSRRRSLFVVASVAIGVGALVAINSFTDALRDSVRGQVRTLLGADLVVGSNRPFDARAQELLSELQAATRPPARSAQVVSFAAMAFVARGSTARLVQVRAVDAGYPFYGTVETEPPGAWPSLAESGGAIVDAALLPSLGARVGDVLTLGEATFEVRAVITGMPGDVGLRSALGPRVFIPRGRVGETRLLGFGARGSYEAYLRLPAGADAPRLAGRFRARLARERLSLRSVSDDQQRLADTLGRFGDYLGLVAFAALLLGGLGVASTMHVLVRRRLPTIAILRCMGASSGVVLAAYLLQAGLTGLAGSALGAALGALLQLALPAVLQDVLPVDVSWRASPRAIVSGVAIGTWVALLFSLLPLLSVRRVSPLAALRQDEAPQAGRHDLLRLGAMLLLASSVAGIAMLQAGRAALGLAFATGVAASLAVLWLAAWLLVRTLRRFFPTRLPYLWRQGLANLYRPGNQTVMVVLALGFGAFLLSTLQLVQANLLRELRIDTPGSRPNLVFFDVQPDEREDVMRRAAAAGTVAMPAVPIVPMRIQAIAGRTAAEWLAIEDDTARPARWALRREYRSSYRDRVAPSERVVEGSWWRPGGGASGAGSVPVALEVSLARELRVGLGDEIVWDVQGVSLVSRVVALREVAWARFEPNFFVVFPEGPLDAAPQTHVVLARVEDAGQRARLQRAVVEAHPNVSALDLSQVQEAIEGVIGRVALAMRFMGSFSLAAGAFVLAGAVAASRQQRAREGALLRALGATRRQIVRILVAEYAVLGALAAGTALLIASAAGWALVRFAYDGRFAWPGPALLVLLSIVLGLTVLVGLAGSREVWRRPPLDVLRSE